jgi:hypothetical protein
VVKRILTSSGLALALTVAVPFAAHGQAQPNQPPTAASPPSTQPPADAASAHQTREPDAAGSTRHALPNTASAWPFIALAAILAVALGAAIRIGVNTID